MTNLPAIEYDQGMKEVSMEYEIKRQVNRQALEAANDAIHAQMAREGISIYEQNDEQKARVEAIRQHVVSQYAEADLAESLLAKMANRSDEAAFIDLLSREHAYLLDKIAYMVLKAVSTRINDSGNYVDGRISPDLAEFASRYAVPLRRAR